jgi:ABC-type nitrate/sulfonate/bicarbonate transport system substrate-binding protein
MSKYWATWDPFIVGADREGVDVVVFHGGLVPPKVLGLQLRCQFPNTLLF